MSGKNGDRPLQAGYSRGEVIHMLGIGHGDAIAIDASPRSSMNPDGDMSSNAETTVFAIARWWDVHGAKEEVTKEKRDQMIVQLRSGGFGEEEIASLVGLSRSTTRRRFKAKLAEILERLGHEEDEERLDHIDLCLTCGKRPRVRLAEVRAELWTLIGRRRDPDGRPRQTWLDGRNHVVPVERPLAVGPNSGRIGAVRQVILTQGSILRHRDEPDERLGADDQRVRAWIADTRDVERAKPGEAIVLRGSNLAGRGGTRVVLRERQTSGCEVCLRPELQPRVIRTPTRTSVAAGRG